MGEKKELFTDSEGIEYTQQIKFPCAICTVIIPDWRIGSDQIGCIQFENQTICYHKSCAIANNYSEEDILELVGLQTPKENTIITEVKKKKQFLKDATIQAEPSEDTKREALEEIVLALQERPMTRKHIEKATNVPYTTIYWRVWENDTDTPEFNEDGKKCRKQELFIRVGNAPRGVAVFGLMNHNYPEDVLKECRKRWKFAFEKWFYQ